MTKEEFLLNTINHFNSTNRGWNGTDCIYGPTETSKGCAIGRWLEPEVCKTLDSVFAIQSIDAIIERDLVPIPQWMLELSKTFLVDIQELHDEETYWNTQGLSDGGIWRVRQLISNHNLDQQQFKNIL